MSFGYPNDDPYYQTAAQEAESIAEYQEWQDGLRDMISGALQDCRGELYLADVRKIVIEELNKLKPLAGEPDWQTKTPVPVPPLG